MVKCPLVGGGPTPNGEFKFLPYKNEIWNKFVLKGPLKCRSCSNISAKVCARVLCSGNSPDFMILGIEKEQMSLEIWSLISFTTSVAPESFSDQKKNSRKYCLQIFRGKVGAVCCNEYIRRKIKRVKRFWKVDQHCWASTFLQPLQLNATFL